MYTFSFNSFFNLLLLFIFLVFYVFGFVYTPDYKNYMSEWFGTGYDYGSFSDPLARFYYSFFSSNKFISPLALIPPLILYIYASTAFKLLPSLILLSMHPVIYGSLVNPRFFFASVFFTYSLILLTKSRFITSTIFLLISFSTHLGLGLLLPLYLLIFLFKINKSKFSLLFLIITTAIFILIGYLDIYQLLDIFEYRLEYAIDEDSGASMSYLHLIFFITLISWLNLNKFNSDKINIVVLRSIVFSGLIVCILSFVHYNLMISRILHALSFIAVCFSFRCCTDTRKLLFLSLFFLPVSFLLVYPGFYFYNYYMFFIFNFIFIITISFYIFAFTERTLTLC